MGIITKPKTGKIEIVTLDKLDKKDLAEVIKMYINRWGDVLRGEFEDKYLSLPETDERKGAVIIALDELDKKNFKEAVGYSNGGNFTLTNAFMEEYAGLLTSNLEILSSAGLERRIESIIGREEALKSTSRMGTFPEGQKVALVNGKPKGAINSLVVEREHGIKETWNSVTSSGYINDHISPENGGNTLICFAIYTAIEGGAEGVAKALITAQKEMAIDMALEGLLAYSRFTDYKQHMEKHGYVPPEKYIFKKYEKGRYVDHATGFHLSQGAYPVKVFKNARPADENSCGFCIIMEYPLRGNLPTDLFSYIACAFRFGPQGINHMLQLNRSYVEGRKQSF